MPRPSEPPPVRPAERAADRPPPPRPGAWIEARATARPLPGSGPRGSGRVAAGLGPKVGRVLDVRILSGTRAGEQLQFFEQNEIRIGRNPAADVVLPDGAVSRQHAELAWDGIQYVLSDLGSTAGTWLLPTGERVSSLPIPSFAEVALGQSGPRVRIGAGLSVPFGRYHLTGRLGGGGMAEVYLARQTGLGGFNRPVAIKLIQPEMFDVLDPQAATAMFLDEARIAAEINHHNVVKIYDVGEHDGVLFLAMEYLRGVTLSHLNAQLHHRGERMPPDLVAALLSQACAGLHAAHQLRDASGRSMNVVHRDVSPSNLMLLPEGLVKVIDFGVARAEGRLLKSEEGLQGKPAYMSPEQIQGQPLDCRSDVFAIGVVLHELCAGQALFQRDDTVATFYAVVRGEAPALQKVCPTASPLLQAIVQKALAKDPAQRFQSAADLAAELDQVVLEAGGRFSSIAATVRFLTEWGVSLLGSPPTLLTQVPKALYAARGQRRPLSAPADDGLEDISELAEAVELSALTERPAARPGGAAGGPRLEPSAASARSDSGADSGGVPKVDPPGPKSTSPQQAEGTASGPPGSSIETAFLPLSHQPARIVNTVFDDRFRLLRWLGQRPRIDCAFPKLVYQAQLLPKHVDDPAFAAARAADLLKPRDPQVAVLLCGRGPNLQAFEPAMQDRLRRFAETRRLPGGPDGLAPVLSSGTSKEGVPYLVMPYFAHTLPVLQQIGMLPLRDALVIGRRLCAALVQAVTHEPGYVHGDIKPYNVGLWPQRRLTPLGAAGSLGTPPLLQIDPLHVVLLDVNLEFVLGAPQAKLPERATLTASQVPYLSPERWAGGPPSPQSDVYSVGAILYELLGGDAMRAAHALRSRRGVPRLPPQRGLGAQLESAVFAALRYDAGQRPDAQTLLALLDREDPDGALRTTGPGSGRASRPPLASVSGQPGLRLPAAGGPGAVQDPSGALVPEALPVPSGPAQPEPPAASGPPPVRPPAPGTRLQLRSPSGRDVVLLTLPLPAVHPVGHPPLLVPLPLSLIPDLLPVPLVAVAHGGLVRVELDGSPGGRGRDRPSLYHDAYDPSTRGDSITLLPAVDGVAHFDAGHRRLSVQRLHYTSVLAAPAPQILRATVPDLGLTIETEAPAHRLILLWTEAPQSGVTYVTVIPLS